jgi:hypothetical protein
MFWPLTASTLSCLTLLGCATVPSIFNALDTAFDSDSFIILIDNCCSACVTNELADFEGVPVKVQVTVKGIGGAIKHTHKGTIRWAIQDNQGVNTKFYITDSYYAPEAPFGLLSPQHWSKCSRDNVVGSNSTWSGTFHDRVELHWSNNTCHCTIMLDTAINIAFIGSTPGYKNYRIYTAIAECMDNTRRVEMNNNTIQDLHQDLPELSEQASIFDDDMIVQSNLTKGGTSRKQNHFNDITVEDDNDPDTSNNASNELLKIHICFQHLPAIMDMESTNVGI